MLCFASPHLSACLSRGIMFHNQGDMTELSAVQDIFQRSAQAMKPLVLGALKTHIGHSEGAAGLMSAIRACLCMSRATMPHNLHFHTMVDTWGDLAHKSRAVIPTSTMRLPKQQLVGVSSFGFGGSLCHAILTSDQVAQLRALSSGKSRCSELRCFQQHPFMQQDLAGSAKSRFRCSIDPTQELHASLLGHRVDGRAVLPAEACLEVMLTVARLEIQQAPLHVRDVKFNRLVGLPSAICVSCEADQVSVLEESSGKLVATGAILAQSSTDDRKPPPAETHVQDVSRQEVYSMWPEYGESYRLIEKMQIFNGVACAKLIKPCHAYEASCRAAPTGLLDAGLQVLATAMRLNGHLSGKDMTYSVLVPAGVGHVVLHKVLACKCYESRAWWDRVSADSMSRALTGHVVLLEGDEVVAALHDCQFKIRPRTSLDQKAGPMFQELREPQVELQQLVLCWEEVDESSMQSAPEQALRSQAKVLVQPCDAGSFLYQGRAMSLRQMMDEIRSLTSDKPLAVVYVVGKNRKEDDVLKMLEAECEQMLGFAKALSSIEVDIKLVVVTSCAASATDSAVCSNLDLAQSSLSGMCMAFRAERPQWRVMQLDLEPSSDGIWTIGEIVEKCINSCEPILALRSGKFRALRLRPMSGVPAALRAAKDDHIIITGGLGGTRAWL